MSLQARTAADRNTRGNLVFRAVVLSAADIELWRCEHGHKIRDRARECARSKLRRVAAINARGAA